MKKILIGLALSLTLALTSCSSNETEDTTTGKISGEFEGTAKGYMGDVTVSLTLKDNVITDATIKEQNETSTIGGVALETLTKEIVKINNVNVDVQVGASLSSNAFIEASKLAIEKAEKENNMIGELKSLIEKKENSNEEITKEAISEKRDVVVIGAGGAGMTSAIELHREGYNVLVLEKMPFVGGNTSRASGGINAAETHLQDELGIKDSVEQFIEDTMEGGYQKNDPELVRIMAENSAKALEWTEGIGLEYGTVTFSGGATNARIHSTKDGGAIGTALVDVLQKEVEKLNIPVYLNTEATKLITDENGAVIGVLAESKDKAYTINADSVVLATGGFGANEDMYVKYKPELKGFISTNAAGATGDGIIMAEVVGAGLTDIEEIQIHPTVEQSTQTLVTESVRGDGAILVNKEGKRYTNELLTRDRVSAATLAQTDKTSYLIFDDTLRNNKAIIEKYVSLGIVVEASSLEELAEKIGVNKENLVETVKVWNEAVVNKKDSEFGRETGMKNEIKTGKFYAINVAPGVHHTMGGVSIDTSARVLNTEKQPIEGLYAAGEVVGGVHGQNRIGGNAVIDILVFGLVAAETINAEHPLTK